MRQRGRPRRSDRRVDHREREGNAKLLDFGLARWTGSGRQREALIIRPTQGAGSAHTGKPPSGNAAPSGIDAHLPPDYGIVEKSQSVDLNEQYQASATLAAELRAVAAMIDVRRRRAVTSRRQRARARNVVWLMALVMLGASGLLWTVSKMR